jgi:maltose O-acetyltransferase
LAAEKELNPWNAMNTRILVGGFAAYVFNNWWNRIPSTAIRFLFLRWWLANLGSGVNVQLHCVFLNARKISVGKRSVINFGTLIDGRRFAVRIGSDVSIGPEASILTLGHDPQSPVFADRGGTVVIGDRAWIGYRAIILPGVTIGEGAVVGAGAVVTKNVAEYTIVAGNPARKIGDRRRDLTYRLDYHPFLL